MEQAHELTSNYVALIDQIRSLLSRDNLCSSTYLFKHLKSNLTLPLYALAEERKIAQLTTNEQDILQAIQESGLARVQSQREITIIDYPTIKISTNNQEIFQQIETVLKQHQKRYQFTQRPEKQYINLTLYEEEPAFLDQLIPSLSKEVEFERVALIDDIKVGIARVKKLKAEQKNNGFGNHNGYNSHGYKNGVVKYSLEKPPQIFIRKAVQSSDEEEEGRGRGRQGQRKKRYKQVVRESPKVVLNHEDFPSLS